MCAMTSTLGRLVTLAAVAGLSATGLSGCGLLDGSSRVQEALEYLPDDATSVTFVDRSAIAERQDLDALETGASEKAVEEWAQAQQEEGYGTELSRWAAVMQEAAFSEFDIEWEATGSSGEGLVRVWKLSDDTDFDDIADDLEDAGYRRSDKDDAEVFEADLATADTSTGLFGGRYPSTLISLALVPDEHLVLSGNVDEGLDVVTDGKDSLADEGSFDDLLDQAPSQDDLEYAGLTISPACGGGRLSPEQMAQQYEGLSYPDGGMALFAEPGSDLRAVRLLSDENDPEADAEGLATYLDVRAAATGFDIDVDVKADGDAVVAEAAFEDRRAMVQAWTRSEGPFACPLAT